MTPEKIDAIIHEIYVELFKAAEPPAVFDDIIDIPQFYLNHYLSGERQAAIIAAVLKKRRVREPLFRQIWNTVILGYSPTSITEFNDK
jgi:hypothetical protein